MAYDLIVDEAQHRVSVHRLTCKVFSTIDRTYHHGGTVTVEDGWEVRRCVVCLPQVHVVTVSRATVTSDIVNQYHQQQEALRDGVKLAGAMERERLKVKWQVAWNSGVGMPKNQRVEQAEALDVQPTYTVNDEWMNDANCRGTGRLGRWLDWLFHTEHYKRWAVTLQREICMGCTVRAECLEQGVWGLEAFGVWGGATIEERKVLRKKWEAEGRVDVRPYRPHSPGGRSDASPGGDIVLIDGGVRRANGSRVTDTRRDERRGTGEVQGGDTAAGDGVPTVRATWDMQGPGPDEWSDEYWGSESFGLGGSTG